MSQPLKTDAFALAAATVVQKIINSIPPIFGTRLKTNKFHCVFNNALLLYEPSGKIRISPCITYDAKHIFIGPKEPYQNEFALTQLFRDLFSDLFNNAVEESALYVLVLGNMTVYMTLRKGMTEADIPDVKINVLTTIRVRMDMKIYSEDRFVQAENARIIVESYGLENVMETLKLKERRPQ